MINILSKLTLGVLFRIVDYLNCFSHDIDDFASSQFKKSKVREVLKEEFLKVNLFNELQNFLNEKVVASGVDLVKWNRFVVEKEYPKDPDRKCDIFLEGQVARHSPSSSKIVYKKDTLREAWIELKFFIPTHSGTTANVGSIVNDLLRLIYLTENAEKDVDIERYLIVFILCGKKKGKTPKDIINYLGSNPTMLELFLPEDDKVEYIFDFNNFLREQLKKEKCDNFIEQIKVFSFKNEINLGSIDITRRIITPIESLSSKLNFSDFNKNLFGYIFKIDSFSKVEEEKEIVDLGDKIKEIKEKKEKAKIEKYKRIAELQGQ